MKKNSGTDNSNSTEIDITAVPRRESAHQKMAFETYRQMGPSRSLRKLADLLGTHENTPRNWSTWFRWMDRLKEYERASADRDANVQAIQQQGDLRKKHVNVYDIAINKAVKQIAEGNVKIRTVGELIQLIDARWKLAAQTTKDAHSASTLNFNGPTQLDLGLEKMNREERLKFIQDMLKGIMRIQTRPRMGEGRNTNVHSENTAMEA